MVGYERKDRIANFFQLPSTPRRGMKKITSIPQITASGRFSRKIHLLQYRLDSVLNGMTIQVTMSFPTLRREHHR